MKKEELSQALAYHIKGRPGKIEVIPSKPARTQRDLSLAYSPGVAEPCLEIAKDPSKVFDYTIKGNLVAVISNGTAVLGLGDLGPEASKPVMEGKGILFKVFADIDVFDIEVKAETVEEFIAAVKAIEPTFGGINLEDIKAPQSFEIEERLKKELNIPVMHDDQHGTAIISAAALLNALELANKKIDEIKMVINGAGASAIACGKLFVALGVQKENLVMLDSKGPIKKSRSNLSPQKEYFATDKDINSLEEAMINADVFVGLSKGNILNEKHILSMADNPIVFAMANPDPEIDYNLAISIRKDIIMATGRSDYPNQVNNVLGFPFIFRGALDVRATDINEEMKLAAVKALAQLAKEDVPDSVSKAYNKKNLTFGKKYIIPKPLDPRLITIVAPAVAKAAIESGVARKVITDWEEYKESLRQRMGLDNKLLDSLAVRAKQDPKRVVFAEADKFKILKAAELLQKEGIAQPILLGNKEKIEAIILEHSLEIDNSIIIDPRVEEEMRQNFAEKLFEKRKRKGITLYDAGKKMGERNYFGSMMLELGQADVLISGLTRNYPETIKPALQVIGKQDGVNKVAGMYVLMSKKGPVFFADTTVNINPSWEDIVDITVLTHRQVKQLDIEPRIALLSFSNFGSSHSESSDKMAKAVEYLHKHYPEIIVDGEMQANFALDGLLREENYPFSKLGKESANTFIFPNLDAGNIAYKMVQNLAETETIGPVLMGFKKSVHILQLGSSIREIVNMVTLAVVDAQFKAE